MTKKKKNLLRVTLVRSLNRRSPRHRACVRGLGLRRMWHSVLLEDSKAVRGMVCKVSYMVKVEEGSPCV